MLSDSNTKEREDLNTEEKKVIRMPVSVDFANEILSKIDAPTPDASEIQEIHLIIK